MGSFLYQHAFYVRALLGLRASRFQDARRQRDLGASAIELAIITAIIVGLAIVVLIAVKTVITNRSQQITTNNNQLP